MSSLISPVRLISPVCLNGAVRLIGAVRRRHGIVRRMGVGVAVMMCAAGLAACNAVSAAATHSQTPTGVGAPSAGPLSSSSSAPSAVPSSPSPASAASPSATPASSRACQAANFSTAEMVEGAMGSAYYTITVTNHGSTCTLSGRPVLYYTRADGRVGTIPFVASPSGRPTSVTLAHGRSADIVLRTPNGYGGYAPGSPQCAHPATYRGVSIGVGTGRVALANFVLGVTCEGVTLYDFWARG